MKQQPYRPRRGLRMRQVEAKTGLKRSQITDAVHRGIFPKPFRVLPGGRALIFDEQEIDDHLERQMMADRVPKCATPAKQHAETENDMITAALALPTGRSR